MILRRRGVLALAATVAMGISACDPGTQAPPAADAPTAPGAGGATIPISGAGATFPAPLFQRWFAEYNRANPNVQVSYQSVGSGAGLEQYIAGTVDFGASEAPLTTDEARLASFRQNYEFEPLQIPIVGGHIVFSYNLPGIDTQQLRLARTTYCGIVEGTITNWNDPAIAQDNPNLQLPNLPITWVHRSDGSGTTFVFVNHIDTVCPGWQAGVGTSVDWPVGIGGQGNEGVSAAIEQNEGAIGYIAYGYAALNDTPVALIENAAGNFPEPSPANASSALLGEEVPADFALLVPDPQGENAYPIVGLVWVLVYREYEDPQRWQAMRSVFEWALGPEGRRITEELFYVPLPDELVRRIQQEFEQVQAG